MLWFYSKFVWLDKPAEEIVAEKPSEEQPAKVEEKEVVATESTSDVETKDVERESKEPSSEPQFKDAEKVIEGEEEVYDDNDSEYEDVDEEEDIEQGGEEEQQQQQNLASVQVRKRRFKSRNYSNWIFRKKRMKKKNNVSMLNLVVCLKNARKMNIQKNTKRRRIKMLRNLKENQLDDLIK